MPTVELVYDRDCPNVEEARTHLLRALAEARLVPSWSEHQIGDETGPEYTRGCGSPTILVDGRDVSGAHAGSNASCRVYRAEDGRLVRSPTIAQIVSALAASPDRGEVQRSTSGWRSSLAMVPGIGAALLPKVACPACWPAYAGFLSSVGLGFLMETAWLFPLTLLFFGVAVFALAFRAGGRRGYGPFALGLVAAAVVLLGKFAFDSDSAMYTGLGLLVLASLWNTWPHRKRDRENCPTCASQTMK